MRYEQIAIRYTKNRICNISYQGLSVSLKADNTVIDGKIDNLVLVDNVPNELSLCDELKVAFWARHPYVLSGT